MRRPLGSVRVRTTVTATLAVGIALSIGAVVMVEALERSLATGVLTAVQLRATELATEARSSSDLGLLTLDVPTGGLVQAVDSSGRVVAASSQLQGKPPIGPFRPPGTGRTTWLEQLTADDELYRVVGVSTGTPSGQVTIFTASSLESATDSVTRVKGELAIGLPLMLLVVIAICWLTVGRALRPVEAIRSRVAEIGLRALDRRVPEPPVQDEVGRLARTMNAMLDRLQASSERQRRFVAHASHELRSPLASLRAQLEVERAYFDPGGGRAGSLSDQLAEIDRMERLVDDLLLLARADERKLPMRRAACRLDEIVLGEAARIEGTHSLRLDTSRVAAATVQGDADGLTRVLRNLLENAVRHARSEVTVGLHSVDSHVEVTVADDGPGIPPDQRERVFERFTRLDESRSREGGGAGLGLAIAREIVAAHGGAIRVAEAPFGACLVVELPAAGAPRQLGSATA